MEHLGFIIAGGILAAFLVIVVLKYKK